MKVFVVVTFAAAFLLAAVSARNVGYERTMRLLRKVSQVLMHKFPCTFMYEEQSEHKQYLILLLYLQSEEKDDFRKGLLFALGTTLAENTGTCKTCWKYFGVISKHMRMTSKIPVRWPLIINACSAMLHELQPAVLNH